MAILSMSSSVKGLNSKETVIYKVFNDVITDETKSDAVRAQDNDSVMLVVEAGASVSGGVVKLEGAITSDYAGTWAELGSVTTSAASTAYKVAVADNPMPYVRARIETAIAGGGSVDAYIIVRQ